MPRTIARGQSLPDDEVAILATLHGAARQIRVYALFEAGWPLSAIGVAVGHSRSTVHGWISEIPKPENMPTVPEPAPKFKYVPKKLPSTPILPSDHYRLRELAVVARRFRGVMAPTHPAAIANREYAELIHHLHLRGTSVRDIAEAANASERAIRRRLQA